MERNLHIVEGASSEVHEAAQAVIDAYEAWRAAPRAEEMLAVAIQNLSKAVESDRVIDSDGSPMPRPDRP
jgi:hypothetical protein